MGCWFYTGGAVGPDSTWQDCQSDDGDPPGVVDGTTFTQVRFRFLFSTGTTSTHPILSVQGLRLRQPLRAHQTANQEVAQAMVNHLHLCTPGEVAGQQ